MKKSLWVFFALVLSFGIFLSACDEDSKKQPAFYPHTAELARISNEATCPAFGTKLLDYLTKNEESLKTSSAEMLDVDAYKNPIYITFTILMAANLYKFSEKVSACEGDGSQELKNAMDKYNSIEGLNTAVQAGVKYEEERPK